MPRLQDIERFKHDLAALAHETETLARWGEEPVDIPPPGGSEGAQELEEVAPQADRGSRSRPSGAAPEAEEGLPPDFAALLDNLPLDVAAEETGEGAAEGLGSPLEAVEEPEFGAGEPGAAAVGEGGATPEEPEFDLEAFALPEEAAEAEEPPPPEEPAPGEEPAALEEPAPEEVEGSAAPGGEYTVPELGDFDFGGGAETPASETAESDFSIPEMEAGGGEVGLPEEQGPAQAEEPGSSQAEAETAAPEEGFSFGESLGTEESAEEGGGAGSVGEGGGGAAPSAGAGASGAGAQGARGDGFDAFTFEEGAGAEPSLGADLDAEIAALSSEVGPGETFSLDQEWGGFGGETAASRQAPPRAEAPRPARPAAAAEERARPVALTEAQIDRLQDALLSYPLNLRVAIEDILANEKGSEAQQSKLIWSLVEGASAEEAALTAGRILKRRIEIPRGFEKKTGAAIEAEKGSFRYAFVHTVLPALRIGAAAAIGAALLGWLGWRFIYTPLAADALYRSGYQRIAEDRYPEAEEAFNKATAMREFIAWYYRYAGAYAAKRQYFLAEGKYASLIERHPHERAGILAWARLERDQLKYEEAVQVLKGVPQPLARVAPTEAARGKSGLLSWDYYNKDGLLLLGDVYLDWGDEDSAKFEDARRAYATLIQHYGYSDLYLERMLLYFIRSDGALGPDGKARDNLSDILALKQRFLARKTNPLSSSTMAELGGYLLDRNLLDDVRMILLAAAKKAPALPEAHYQLVRYFRRAGMQDEERVALDNAVKTFAAQSGLTPRRTAMYLDSLIWRGDYRVAAREWIGAEQDFTTAATLYEQALELRRVKKEARFGEAYAGLAAVAFWQRDDLDSALSLLERAADSGYDTADTRYERGYILYEKARFADSLEQFYLAGKDGTESPYLGFAFGTALYERGDYLSAEAYFRRVAEAMNEELTQFNLFQPDQRPSQAEILELLMKADNNLGASLLRSAALVGDARRRGVAAASLSESSHLHDELVASGVPLGSDPRDLASQNLALAIKGANEPSPVVYTEIEKAMAFPRSGLAALAMNEERKSAGE